MNKKIVNLKDFGRYLRDKRVRAGLTQTEVASQLKYTTGQFISNWETGRSSPPFNALHKISRLYRIPPRELYSVLLQQYQHSLSTALKLGR